MARTFAPYIEPTSGSTSAGKPLSLSNNLIPVRYQNPAPPSGNRLLDGWLYIGCGGGTDRAVFQYTTPWLASADGTDQIYWQKQPGTVNDQIDVIWNDGSGRSYKAGGSLSQDQIIKLSPAGVTFSTGRPAQATLPSLSLG